MLFWAHGGCGQSLHQQRMSARQRNELHREMYEFTEFLLTIYNETGKTFLLGNWEGDWLAGGYEMGHRLEMDPQRIARFREWLDVRTAAIDQAKADTPHRNAEVFTYLELNSVLAAKDRNLRRLVNTVLPVSSVDFVPLSSYDVQTCNPRENPKTTASLRRQSFEIFLYVEQHLPPRDIPGKRVFIGGIGHRVEEIAELDGISIEAAGIQQARAALPRAQVSLEWGTPIWLWWATFSSHEGTFGLVDNFTNEPSPLLFALKDDYQWAREYTQDFRTRHSRLPEACIFRTAAIEQLKKQIAIL